MALRTYRIPFGNRPWTQYHSFSDLPVLDKSAAAALWMLLGVAFALTEGSVVVALATTGKADIVDPMLFPGLIANLLFWFPLLITTGFIGLKQWRYYYGNGSPKDGLFVEKIRQVNEREMIMDVVLSIAGGALIGSCFLPSYWFAMFALYCILVALRCHFTLMRPRYARTAQADGEIVPAFIAASLDENHNGLLVKGIVAGWIVSDLLFAVYGLSAFALCLFVIGGAHFAWRAILFLVLIAVLFVLFVHIIRKSSYTWGLWLLDIVGRT